MPVVPHDCRNCGSPLKISSDGKLGICQVCDSIFTIEDNAVKHRVEGTISIDGLTTKAQLHKRAEQFMSEGNYSSAASLFHEIIDKHDAHDSDAWWGLARVSASDFTSLDRLITREQLGSNYDKAIDYATSDKRSKYEAVIRRHEERYASVIAERKAREAEFRRQEEEAAAQRKVEEERLTRIKRDEDERRRAFEAIRHNKQRMASVIVVTLLIGAALLVWFVIIPNNKYNNAEKLLQAGSFQEAIYAFNALDGYKDSQLNIQLCEALLNLQDGNLPEVRRQIGSLEEQNGGPLYALRLKNAVVEKALNWKQNGLSATSVLYLLQIQDEIDPEKKLDAVTIFNDVHVELAGGNRLLSWYLADMNGDQTDDLVTLGEGNDVHLYKMLVDGNQEVTLEPGIKAACLERFGDNLLLSNQANALACYQQALFTKDTKTVRQKIADLYIASAKNSLTVLDYDAAMEEALAAVEAQDTQDIFQLYYDIASEKVQAAQAKQVAIAIWDSFISSQAERIGKYGLSDSSRSKAGVLRLTYANELASWKDTTCLNWYREAESFGESIVGPMTDAINNFDTSYYKLTMRFFILDRLGGDAPGVTKQKEAASVEIKLVLANWKAYCSDPQQAIDLLKNAKAHEMNFSGINTEAVYKEAAMEIAGGSKIEDSFFMDWNKDGWQDAVFLDKDKRLSFYMTSEDFEKVASFDLGVMGTPAMTVFDDKPSIVLIEDSAAASSFQVFRVDPALKISRIMIQTSINKYDRDQYNITFETALPGSIPRFSQMQYSLELPDTPPLMVGVDWQRDSYPQPESGEAAILRYFEAVGYGIPGEATKLTASENPGKDAAGFSLHALQALPTPQMPLNLACNPYLYTQDKNTVLSEVSYDNVVTYIASARTSDGWRVVGAQDSFLPEGGGAGDQAFTPIPINDEVDGRLSDEQSGNTYRVLLPYSAEFRLGCQVENANNSGSVLKIRISRATDREPSIVNYAWKPSASITKASPLYLHAGVYNINATVDKRADVSYTLTVDAVETKNMELEPNDAIDKATSVSLGQTYSASLQTKEDLDLYRFVITEPGKVTATLKFDATESENSPYRMSVANVADIKAIASVDATGKVGSFASPNLYLDAGEYVLQVTKGEYWTSEAYNITVESISDASTERENNDALENATEIQPNVPITASFAKQADVDWYKVNLSGNTVVQLALSFTPLERSSKAYTMTVKDNAGAELMVTDVGGKESDAASVPICLTAGTYYARIENPNWTSQDYTFTVRSMLVEGVEIEPNDKLAEVTSLEKGKPLTGVLASEKDRDIYLLNMAESATITLSFSFPTGKTENPCFALEIEQNGKSLWNTTMTSSSGGFSAPMQISAGAYYIRVKPYVWSSTVYTIAVY